MCLSVLYMHFQSRKYTKLYLFCARLYFPVHFQSATYSSALWLSFLHFSSFDSKLTPDNGSTLVLVANSCNQHFRTVRISWKLWVLRAAEWRVYCRSRFQIRVWLLRSASMNAENKPFENWQIFQWCPACGVQPMQEGRFLFGLEAGERRTAWANDESVWFSFQSYFGLKTYQHVHSTWASSNHS